MAIVLEERKKGVNWFVILVFLFLFVVVIAGGYFLFFASTPGIEIVAPSILRSTSNIAEIELDPSQVISHPTLKRLRQYGGLPSVGSLGRTNPLLSF